MIFKVLPIPQRVPIIVFSDVTNTIAINKVIKAGVSAYIVNGIDSQRIKPIIDIAIARFSEQKSLKDELEKTKSKLEERKLIDRAKGILIKTRGFSCSYRNGDSNSSAALDREHGSDKNINLFFEQ